jgi:hypothetical protein
MRNADLPLYADREVLVLLDQGKGNTATFARLHDLTILSARTVASLKLDYIHARVRSGADVMATIRSIESAPNVAWAQPNYIYQLLGNSRETALGMHGLDPSSSLVPNGLPPISSASKLVLIDSSVDASHPSLAGARIEQTGELEKAPPSPHGTAIAEILLGSGTYKGVAQGAQLVSIPAFTKIAVDTKDVDKKDAPFTSTSSRLINAFELAIVERPNVLNLSFGSPTVTDPVIRELIERLYLGGVCITAAAGNSADAPVMFPAKVAQTIAVAAVDASERKYRHGSSGPEIDIAAWGVDIFAAVPGGRRDVSGTSFAAPVVAGAMLRMPACSSARRPGALRKALAQDAKDLGDAGKDDTFGSGLLRFAEGALQSDTIAFEELPPEVFTPIQPKAEDDGNFALLAGGGGALAGGGALFFLLWRRRKQDKSAQQ